MIIADCLSKNMNGKNLLGVLEDEMLQKSYFSADHFIKAVSMYAPAA